ncbi:MAG: hypothetical protein ACRENE_07730, partial [Polyangiaceae bacterium]
SGSALADSHGGRCFPVAGQGPAAQCPPAMAGPRVEVVDESGSLLAAYYQGGRTFVEGDIGARYLLRIVNPTPRRVEAVVSVDGLDAIDGRPASTAKRGYLVPAYGEVTVDGWRTSLSAVAAFRFSSVRGSYAGRTGHDRNVGVIGVAFFRERPPRPLPRPLPDIARPAPAAGGTAPAAPSSAGRSSADAAPRKSSSAPAGAGAAAEPRAAQEYERPGLGTEFGEAHDSSVSEVSFVRAETTPSTVAQLWYDDRDGLIARGIPIYPRDDREAETRLRDTAQPFADRFAQPPP